MRRIKVFYDDEIKEGSIMYQSGSYEDRLGMQYGVIFDDGSTDTITDYNDYKML